MIARCSSAVLLAIFSLNRLEAQTKFVPLGFLDNFGPTSEANATTPDGSKIVGYSTTSLTENQSCVWASSDTWSTGTIAPLPGMQNWYNNDAIGISADGNVIVGLRSFGGTEEAFYYTPAGQIQLVPFSSSQRSTIAYGVTGNGQVVVGTAIASGNLISRAFRWDRSQANAVLLPAYPPSSVPNAGAFAVSDDGRRLVGWVQTSLNTQAAAYWDDGGTPALFNQAGDTVVAIAASSVSPDGSIVVGAAVNIVTGKDVAFKWTAAGGVVALPNPTTGYYAIDGAYAIRISRNGRVIVGYGVNVAGDEEAIFWVDGQPYRVSDVANAAGVLPPSWEPFRAYGVDYFGNTICGHGRSTSGKVEAYVLILDATPAPPALVAPTIQSAFNATTSTLSFRYMTVPGLRYRVVGGSTVNSLTPLGDWSNGLGIQQEFSAGPAMTGGAQSFFLRLEVSQN